MLRAILLYFSKAMWARKLITGWGFARRAASRFVAGETISEVLLAIQKLNQDGMYATIDHLGESVNNLAEAHAYRDIYLHLIDEIERTDVKASLSLKLTALGLDVDLEECWANLHDIVQRAASAGIFVRIDMEDSPAIDHTLDLFKRLRADGLDNAGLVIQSYLFRSAADTRAILEMNTPIRMVKGAYNEPPEISFARKSATDESFDQLVAMIIDRAIELGSIPAAADGHTPPLTALGTHDEKRIAFGKQYAAQKGLPASALEIQMLYGIRTEFQRALVREGFPVRVYVPYGTEWYPYFTRRLAERPANIWFLVSNFFKK